MNLPSQDEEALGALVEAGLGLLAHAIPEAEGDVEKLLLIAKSYLQETKGKNSYL